MKASAAERVADSDAPVAVAGEALAPAPTGEPRKPPAALRGRTLVALFALYFIWGSTFLVIRVALPVFPPLQLTAIRFLSAGGLLFLFLRLRGAPLPPFAQWRNSLLIGALLVSSNAFVCIAEQWVSSGVAAVLIGSVPIWVALFSALFGSAPTRGEVLGLSVGLCGVAVLNLGGDLRASPAGALVLVCSTVCWAFGSIWSRKLSLPRGPMASAAQMICGGGALLCASLLHGDRLREIPPLVPTLALVYLVVFGSMVGYSAYQYLLGKVRPAVATSYAYVNPVVAVALGALFAGEKVAPSAIAALVLILAGVGLVTLLHKQA